MIKDIMIGLKRVLYVYVLLIFISSLAFLTSCSVIDNENTTATSHQHKKKGEGEIVMEKNINDSEIIRPAFDLAIPDQLDTATLAMG
jgi:hypothetical protein